MQLSDIILVAYLVLIIRKIVAVLCGRDCQRVREVTGRQRQSTAVSINPNVLNAHYSNISTDSGYSLPALKHTCHTMPHWITESDVFYALDHLKRTSTGPDNIPYWFLKLASPFLTEPLIFLFKKSIGEASVPVQWKTAHITPVPKVPNPSDPSDFRPISIIPIIARTLEKLIIKHIFYPTYLISEVAHSISDQFAFRPSGSTTAALIHILNDLSQLSTSYSYVHIIALDFSKAFDTVRHSTLMNKLASLPLTDSVYNWLVDNLNSRHHCTKVGGLLSEPLPINASVVQGSPLGPTNFVITASDLKC